MIDANDVTWTPVSATRWRFGVVYEERRKRDWRFLWLRTRTVVVLVRVIDLE